MWRCESLASIFLISSLAPHLVNYYTFIVLVTGHVTQILMGNSKVGFQKYEPLCLTGCGGLPRAVSSK